MINMMLILICIVLLTSLMATCHIREDPLSDHFNVFNTVGDDDEANLDVPILK